MPHMQHNLNKYYQGQDKEYHKSPSNQIDLIDYNINVTIVVHYVMEPELFLCLPHQLVRHYRNTMLQLLHIV